MSASVAHVARQQPAWAARYTESVFRPGGADNVHDFMALAFFTDGSAVMQQGEQIEARAGDVYLIPAGAPHGIVTTRSARAWRVGFFAPCYAAGELAPLLDPFARAASSASKIVHIPGPRQQHLATLCQELQRETDEGASPVHSAVVGKSLLALILAEISRAGPKPAEAEQPGLVGDALRFIERHCLGPISLADVAASVHRSPSHVSTLVRRATGKSVMAWIISGRLAEARNRLLHTDEMVDVIAERVGYADPTHFIRLFRRAHGSTPAAWRAARR